MPSPSSPHPTPTLRVASVFMSLPIGGAEDLALSCALALRQRGILTHFVCLREEGPLATEIRSHSLPFTLLPVAPSKIWNPAGTPLLARWLRAEGIHIVHSHTYHAHTYAIPAANKARLPAIAHHHKTWSPPKWRRRLVLAWLMHHTAKVLCLSEQTAHDLRHALHLPASKVHSLPNAIDPAPFATLPAPQKNALRLRLGLPPDIPIALTVASLQKVKNHTLILEAATRLPPTAPQWLFVWTGTGPCEPSLRAQAQHLGLTSKILFAGPRRPIAPWFQAADIFLLPSHWEGQSLALLQARAASLPILASRIEGNTALLGPNHPGLFDPNHPDELTTLLSLPLASLSHAIPPSTPAHTEWLALLDHLENLYKSLSCPQNTNNFFP